MCNNPVHNNLNPISAFARSTASRSDTFASTDKSTQESIDEANVALGEMCKSVSFVPDQCGRTTMHKVSRALTGLVTRRFYAESWFCQPLFVEAVRDAIQAKKYDLVHVDTIGLCSLRALVGDIPAVLNHHNIESDMMSTRAKNTKNLLARLFFQIEASNIRRAERTWASRFDINITCSDLDSQRLRVIDDRIEVDEIPNGVDTEVFRPSSTDVTDETGIFIGGLSWYPNRDAMEFFATEIWPELSARNPNFKFDLVGRNPSQKLVEIGAHDSRFTVHGFVDDIHAQMARARVYICPIRDGGGTKLKILDALASGKAIVAHPRALDGLTTEDGTNVLVAETPKDFVDSIERVLNDESLRLSLEENARRLAETQYSYDIIGSKLRQLYQQISERSG